MIDKKVPSFYEYSSRLMLDPHSIGGNEMNLEVMTEHVTLDQIKLDICSTYEIMFKELIKMNIKFSKKELNNVAQLIQGDLNARVEQDPIALNPLFIYKLSRSFKIIFYYRIANALFYRKEKSLKTNQICKSYAFYLSEIATRETSIEIHPGAQIGRNFVIDHGTNTLIGATSIIGDNCTILNNVLLGAKSITNNKLGKRHPTLGNNVKIANGVQIFGPVLIGNNVKIGPNCTIHNHIPDNSIVKQVSVQSLVIDKKFSK
ncbi:serine O-acetyltransferase [Yeosuana marina]|uniref:serine O-acetyltransferase n=1 Tax=Yeosuana marina TaxID=1565536 RepID=UPI0030C8B922